MNLRDLQYLVSLAEHRHFGRAAEACFVSQPTLSTQIRKLEDELGVSLVERTPRKVLLTEVGRDIATRAREVLNGVEQIRGVHHLVRHLAPLQEISRRHGAFALRVDEDHATPPDLPRAGGPAEI